MEIQLILGANDSGKSLYAEQLAVSSGEKRIYIATMMPQGEENYRRIEKHIAQRSGKNFATLEIPTDLNTADIPADSVVLLEDVSNLLGNEIFTKGNCAEKVYKDIVSLANRCQTLIAVSISGLCADSFDGETANYINQLNMLNQRLADISATVVEMKNKQPVKIR